MKVTVLSSLALGLFCGCDLTSSQLNADGSDVAQTTEFRPTTNAPAILESGSAEAKPLNPVQAPTPPPDLPAPVQEVVRLAQTTLGDGVLLGYIDNLKAPYSLSADQIIYLSDLGISEPVIQSLVKHSSGTVVGSETSAPADFTQTSQVSTFRSADSMASPAIPPDGQGIFQNDQPSTGPAQGPSSSAEAPSVQYDVVPPTNYVTQAPLPSASEQMFYDSLAPYGAWVDDPDYGVVWQPTVAVVNPGWQPYCDSGNWVWTDCGWYWNSSYSWGWAPFHYGRWCRASKHGWCWVPDTCWGPAWVTWRTCDSHCGWAPLPPHCGWSPTLGFTYYGRGVNAGFGFGLGHESYVYLSWSHFCDRHPGRFCASRTEVVALHAQSRVINNIRGNGNPGVNIHGNNNTVVINNGPGITPVQTHSSTDIPRLKVADVRSPQGQSNLGRIGAGTGIVGAYRPVTGNATVASAIATSPSSSIPHGPSHGPAVPIRPYVGVTVPKTELVGTPRASIGSSTAGGNGFPSQPHLKPSLSNPSGIPTSRANFPNQGEIAARTPGAVTTGYSGPSRTVPRATPIAGNPESSVQTVAERNTPRPDGGGAVPGHPGAPVQNSNAGIFQANPGAGQGTSSENREQLPNETGTSPIRQPGVAQPAAPVYRYYNPAGNNAAVVRYYPGAGVPVHSAGSGYSNPGGTVPAATHAGSSSSGTSTAAHGSKNGR